MAELPVVAIIGRPNVGKSTLFNRLTGRRTALVSDMPGLTRDRRDEVCELFDIPVRLLDTAGLEEAPRGSIPSRMREQSEQAVRDADLILFVIDARDGVTPADEKFADIVRKAGRPTVVVANKCEGRQGDDGFYEAFSIGLGQPIAISAEHGEGIGELEREVLAALGLEIENLADDESASDDDGAAEALRPIRVAIVGRPNAGKSTLVNALLGEDRMITGPEPGLTRDSIETDFSWNGRAMRLVDTAGLRRKSRITEKAEKLSVSDTVRALRFAEVVVVMIDAEHPFEHQDLTIASMVADEGRAIVIAINKWDLVAEKQSQLKALRDIVERKLAQVPGVQVVTVSALAERGLDKLMAAILSAHGIWNKRIATASLNEWLRSALDRHPPPAVRGRRIRLRYITQPSARPPTFIAFTSRPKDLPTSYVRYLLNSLREAFGLPGTPIRLNLRKGENPYADRK
ncbi:MAG: ribosome biogenesis GTPase Der [Hyphomicrobiaceae bacterium]